MALAAMTAALVNAARRRDPDVVDAAHNAAEAEEFKRLQSASNKPAPGGIPKFYLSNRTNELVVASDPEQLCDSASLSCEQTRALFRSASRHVEVERYMELIELWESLPPSRFWDALRDVKRAEVEATAAAMRSRRTQSQADPVKLRAGAASDNLISYHTFLDAVAALQRSIMKAYPGDAGLRICELVTGARPGGLATTPHKYGVDGGELGIPVEGYLTPKVDATLFMSCPRQPDGTVEFTLLYSHLMVQLSVLKTTAELVMRDSDNDGRLSEIDLENYVESLCKQVPSTANIDNDLVPFFACIVARRLLWSQDGPHQSSVRGFVDITKLIADEELRMWIQCQLAFDESADGWYSLHNFEALYAKFSNLDQQKTSMLRREDFERYKKGIPAVENDGLPRGMCPISELFLDRYFEVAETFAGEMDFKQFVDFTLNVEFLPGKCKRPQLFFDIFDLDGDGYITPTDLQAFFKETRAKLVAAGLQETVPVDLFVREVFDALCPAESLRCSRSEFVNSPQAGVVCGTLIDPLTFFSYDSRDNNVAPKQQLLYRYEQPVRR